MKWMNLETNFFESETAKLLKFKFGCSGVMAFLQMMTTVGKEIHSGEDVEHFLTQGWKKIEADWRRICEFSPSKWKKFVKYLEDFQKISVRFEGIFMIIHFKNAREFVNERALSSKLRKKNSLDSGSQMGPDWVPCKVIRSNKINTAAITRNSIDVQTAALADQNEVSKQPNPSPKGGMKTEVQESFDESSWKRIWALYPKSTMKLGVMSEDISKMAFARMNFSIEDLRLFENAVKNYSAAAVAADPKFVRKFDRFLKDDFWKGYVNETPNKLNARLVGQTPAHVKLTT